MLPVVSILDRSLRVFISYARKDLEFASRLVPALERRGVSAKIDTRDLPKLEDWRRELLGFIRQSDAIVFVISDHSISSPICAWEVEQVVSLHKRLAPIVLRRVPNDRIPEQASRLNYIYFDDEITFEARVEQLVTALQTDLDWLKVHTQLAERARSWSEAARPIDSHVLRKLELSEAERWLLTRPSSAPEPTTDQIEYIQQSRVAETAALEAQRQQLERLDREQRLRSKFQKRSAIALSVVGALILIGLGVSMYQSREAAAANARLLAARSADALKAGDCLLAQRYAIAAIPPPGAMPHVPASPLAEAQLAKAAVGCRAGVVLRLQPVQQWHSIHIISKRRFALIHEQDGQPIITLQDLENPAKQRREALKSYDAPLAVAPQGGRFAYVNADGALRIWGGEESLSPVDGFKITGYASGLQFSDDGTRLTLWSDQEAVVFDIARLELVTRFNEVIGEQISKALMSGDGRRIALNFYSSRFLGDQPLVVFDVETREKIAEVYQRAGSNVFALNQDGTEIAVQSTDVNKIKLLQVVAGSEKQFILDHPSAVSEVMYPSSGGDVWTYVPSEGVRSWSRDDGSLILRMPSPFSAGGAFRRLLNGAYVAYPADGQGTGIWDRNAARTVGLVKQTSEEISSLAILDDGAVDGEGPELYSVDVRGIVTKWPLTVGAQPLKLTLNGHKKEVWSAKFDPHERFVATGSFDGRAIIWSIEGKPIREVTVASGFIERVNFSSTEEGLITLSDYNKLQLWSIATGEIIRPLSSKDVAPLDTEWSRATPTRAFNRNPRGHAIDITLVDASTSETVAVIGSDPGVEGALLDFPAAFDRSGTLAAAGDGGNVKIYDAKTGLQLESFNGHLGMINTVRFSSSGKLLVSTSSDKTARVWNVPATLHLRGDALRNMVCSEYLSDEGVQSFSDSEMQDPLLLSRFDLRNPCQFGGALSLAYWKDLFWPAQRLPPAP